MARTVERPNRYFAFLRRLRAGGRSNMYGAIPYLAAAFGIDRAAHRGALAVHGPTFSHTARPSHDIAGRVTDSAGGKPVARLGDQVTSSSGWVTRSKLVLISSIRGSS